VCKIIPFFQLICVCTNFLSIAFDYM
jgi:hypothetical protein